MFLVNSLLLAHLPVAQIISGQFAVGPTAKK
jgi:hypothetical protein